MLASKKTNLKLILESKDGVHLTAYLVNHGDLIYIKSPLRSTISEACEWFDTTMTTEERNKFLEPPDSLLNDVWNFKQMRGNIGIFRNEEMFRILNIPKEHPILAILDDEGFSIEKTEKFQREVLQERFG